MLQTIIIVAIISAIFWIGYFSRKSEENYRPIVFLELKEGDIVAFWGYWYEPCTNHPDKKYMTVTTKNQIAYFLIDLQELLEDACGEDIVLTFNIGKYSKKNDTDYLHALYKLGNKSVL